MKLLGILVAVFSIFALILGVTTQQTGFYLLFGFGIAAAGTTFSSGGISSYLKIFAAIFSAEFVVFGLLYVATVFKIVPSLPDDLTIPVSVPLTVAMFSVLVFGVSFIPLMRRIMAIADRFFEAPEPTSARVWPFPSYHASERTVAIAMVVALVLINQLQVLLNLRLSFFGRDFINALNAKDSTAFWYQLLFIFPLLAFPYIVSGVVEFVVQSTLIIRWRRWLTNSYTEKWLNHHNHYRSSLSGQLADNPDQRISEDIIRFINGYGTPNGLGVYTISITLIQKFSNLVSFAILLWTLSADFTFPGSNFAVPGFLFWCALIYATIGTIATHVIGKKLSPLAFVRQRFEADFRFALARLREYGEQIALLKGENAERSTLNGRFSAIVSNYFAIVDVRKRLLVFTEFYGQISPFIPYIVGAPFYFAGKITFGVLNQIAGAFSRVADALTFFVDYYVALAEYKSVADRLKSFDESLAAAAALPTPSPLDNTKDLSLGDASVQLPNGKSMLTNVNLTFASNENALLTGPSGSGKSTLFRVLAGIWPYVTGTVGVVPGKKIMVLPQKPYFPIGTLRTATTYPSPGDGYPDQSVRAALSAVRLDGLIDQLDVEDIWSQRLSGGEQQRLAIARALLARPDWLLLDEATSAMDSKLEGEIYAVLAEKMPDTTVISIAHHEALIAHHARRIDMQDIGASQKPALAAE